MEQNVAEQKQVGIPKSKSGTELAALLVQHSAAIKNVAREQAGIKLPRPFNRVSCL